MKGILILMWKIGWGLKKMKTREIENLATAGSAAIRDLCKLADELGYADPMNNQYGELILMLQDNPIMVEAIYRAVIDNAHFYDGLDDNDEDEDED